MMLRLHLRLLVVAVALAVLWRAAPAGSSTGGSPGEPQLEQAVFFGGAGDQLGTGIAVDSGRIFVSGYTGNAVEGIVARFTAPPGTAPVWSTTWPNLPGLDGFEEIAVAADGVYAAGASYPRTIDLVGGKEHKGIVVRFPLDGATGSGHGGADWDTQTPPAPGAFPYGGFEGLCDVATTVEGGAIYAYATGQSQCSWGNGGRFHLSKLSATGAVLWTRTDPGGTPFTGGRSIAVADGHIYVAGWNDDLAGAGLWKYTPSGALVWRKALAPRAFEGLAHHDGKLYAVGATAIGPTADFLIEKWDTAGNRIWSRTFDHAGGEDWLYSVVWIDDRIYAVGSTNGATAGGHDVAVLEVDPGTGDCLSTTLYGGPQDEFVRDAATDGTDLYVIGQSRSSNVGGNVPGQSDVMLLRFSIVRVIPVDITVLRGRINLKGKGRVPVAVLTTGDFDATDVDPDTVELGEPGSGTAPPVKAAEEDVDEDGDTDLLLLFTVPDLVDAGALSEDTTTVELTGTMYDGRSVEGECAVSVFQSGKK